MTKESLKLLMTKARSIINLLLKRSWRQKLEILRIVFLYLKFTMIVELVPLRYYYKFYLENIEYRNIGKLQPYNRELGLIKKLGVKLPWKIKCIVESLVIKNYMKRLGVEIPISLGVSLEEGFNAHAWCLPQQSTAFTEIRHRNEK